MTSAVDLSIVVPTHNRPDGLRRLLTSLNDATPASLCAELVVVDNNTRTELLPALHEAMAVSRLPSRLLAESRPGQSAALNRGLGAATGNMVAFLDDDVVTHKGYFTGIEETIRTFPHNVFGGRVIPAWPYQPPDWVTGGKTLQTSRGHVVLHDYGDQFRIYDRGTLLPIGCNFFCRRSLFERHGMFDTRLGVGAGPGIMGGQETDLLRRFQAAGETIVYTPLVAVTHPVDPARMTKSHFRRRLFCAGRIVPHTSRTTFPSYGGIPRFLYRQLATGMFRAVASLLRARRLEFFDQELALCETLGAMYEFRRLHKLRARA